MNTDWQIALFVLLGGWAASGTAFGLLKLMEVTNRMTRLETQFEDWLDRCGVMAAKALHSPDNHLGSDYYLDKYIKHHFDMSDEEWLEFRDICQGVMDNPGATALEKVQAEFLKCLSEHKLSGYSHAKKLIKP